MKSTQYQRVVLGQVYNKRDIVCGNIRICYVARKKAWVLPGGEIVDHERAHKAASELNDYLKGLAA